jgi:hypothetical protein
MRVAASELDDCEALQTFNLLRDWHEGTPVNIEWHLKDVAKTKLPAGPATEAIDFSNFCKDHGVYVSAGCVDQLVLFKRNNTTWDRLVWVSVFVGRKARSIRVAKLPTCPSTPRVQMTVLKHCHSMRFTAGYFPHF